MCISLSICHCQTKRGDQSRIVGCKKSTVKKDQSIPRLELNAAHLATNLLETERTGLLKHPVEHFYSCSDSLVVLCRL